MQQEVESTNRRKFSRAPLDSTSQLVILDQTYPILTEDISCGGIRLRCGATLNRGDAVKMFLGLPIGSRFRLSRRKRMCMVKGRVAWTNLPRVGIHFDHASEEALQAVEQYLNLTTTEPSGAQTAPSSHTSAVYAG